MRTNSRCGRMLGCFLVLGLVLPVGAQQAGTDPSFSYYYQGELVTLNASPFRVAVVADDQQMAAMEAVLTAANLERDAWSEQSSFKANRVRIFRLQTPANDRRMAKAAGVSRLLQQATSAAKRGEVVQPVFEQGQAVLVPSEQVIVGFKADTTLAQANDFLRAQGQGVVDVAEHRKNTFIARIDNPQEGRSFPVASALAQLPEVDFAEPNLLVSMNVEQGDMKWAGEVPAAGHMAVLAQAAGEVEPAAVSASSWTLLLSCDAESAAFPPAGWTAGYYGAIAATWGRTSYRRHGGSCSIYCAQEGAQGVAPPGPAPLNLNATLITPVLNLAPYEEVYLDLWFYAVNDLSPDPGGYVYDYPAIVMRSASVTGSLIIASRAAGDLTKDATTRNGWRHLLMRVPPALRTAGVTMEIRCLSDSVDRREGAYFDDIRIVGITDVDASPLGNDTYGARMYEAKNTGQIAGYGNDSNDLHLAEAWAQVSVSTSLVVAVIDCGVEPHPDLNLVAGYDYNGLAGGTPKSSADNHGTAVAGNVGAIRNNGKGVMGSAPGVKIMPIYYGYYVADLAKAIDTAVAKGARVLNNSWGFTGLYVADVERAVREALSAGVVVLFAAGNGPDRSPWGWDVAFPANLTETLDVIAVGASSLTDEHKATASSDGSCFWGSSYIGAGPDVCVPSPWSYTTDRLGALGYNNGSDLSDTNYTSSFGGTSSSCPKLAGIVALMLSKNPDLTPADVKRILRETADDIGSPGVDDQTGAGRVNAYAAVMAAASNNPPVIESRTPTNALVFATPGASVRFGIGARDPEGAALTYRWYLDGAVQASASTNCTVVTSSGMVGPHQVRADVSDRGGKTTQSSWQLLVGEGDPNLVGYWSFDDKTGRDLSGWGNDLTIQGGAGFSWDGVKGPDLDLDVQP